MVSTEESADGLNVTTSRSWHWTPRAGRLAVAVILAGSGLWVWACLAIGQR